MMKGQALSLRGEWWTECTFTLEDFDAPVLLSFLNWRNISWMNRALVRLKNAWTAGPNVYKWWFDVRLVPGEEWCTFSVQFWVQYCSISLSSAWSLRWKGRLYPQQVCRKRYTGGVTQRWEEVRCSKEGPSDIWGVGLQKPREFKKKYCKVLQMGWNSPRLSTVWEGTGWGAEVLKRTCGFQRMPSCESQKVCTHCK